jgi:hypothetical protein
MEKAQMMRSTQQAWLLAMAGALLFALGGVATAAQEFLVWIPAQVASAGVVLGLAGCFAALVQVMRVLFADPASARGQQRALLGTMLLAALPPAVFLLWVVWVQVSQSGKL